MGLSLRLGLGLSSSGGALATSALAFSAGSGIDATADSETEPVSKTGFALVAPHPDRYVVVLAVGLFNYTSGVKTPTCTIGGISGTRFSYATSTVFSSFRNVTVGFYAKVPTGATVDVVLDDFTTGGASTGDLAVTVYSFSDLGGSVGIIDQFQTVNATAGTISGTLTPTAAGQVVLAWGVGANSTPTATDDLATLTQDASGDIRSTEIARAWSGLAADTSALTIGATTAAALAGAVLG